MAETGKQGPELGSSRQEETVQENADFHVLSIIAKSERGDSKEIRERRINSRFGEPLKGPLEILVAVTGRKAIPTKKKEGIGGVADPV